MSDRIIITRKIAMDAILTPRQEVVLDITDVPEVVALREERDRLARILAVERGDETQAPEGWRRSIDRAWLYDRPRVRGRWQRPHQIIWRDGHQDIGDDHAPAGDYAWTRSGVATGRASSALEAMEAADAALAKDPT